MGNKVVDLVGKKFNKLEVLSFYRVENKTKRWICKCICGNEKTVRTGDLISGNVKSCGCLDKEHKDEFAKQSIGKPSASRLPNGKAGLNKAFDRYVQNAKKRGIEFLLTIDEAESLFTGICYYCKKLPSMVDRSNKDKVEGYSIFIHNGIDRVDNSRGYSTDNCVSCCKKCNNLKQGVTVNIARKIVQFMDGKDLHAKETKI
jgi:hypothetical protein